MAKPISAAGILMSITFPSEYTLLEMGCHSLLADVNSASTPSAELIMGAANILPLLFTLSG